MDKFYYLSAALILVLTRVLSSAYMTVDWHMLMARTSKYCNF